MTRVNRIAVDSFVAARLFETLRERTLDPPGVTRTAYGAGEQAAHDLVAAAARGLGLSIAIDGAGTLLMTMEGADPGAAPWVVGSHLDSVPHGGNYDGAAGVFAGLMALAALRDQGIVPARPVIVAAFRAEESTWFPVSYLGSRAALGLLPPDVLGTRRSDSGRSLRDHLADLGLDPDAVAAGRSILHPTRIHGFVELHIEQGPVLEAEGIPVGLVTAIAGSVRYRDAVCRGDWAHSGAVPRAHRKDAVVAVADLVTTMDRAFADWQAAGDATTVTFGQVETDRTQHAFSKIAGGVAFCVDVRSPSVERLEDVHRLLLETVSAVEARHGVAFDLGPRTGSTPARLDPGLRATLLALAQDLGIAAREMASGAGHDTATFANAGVPSALVFIRNQNGSHNPDEAMEIGDFCTAAELLAGLLASGR
jgi:N-carbamoyl-L-amino-acid hydrolase